MNSNDERGIVPVDVQGNNASSVPNSSSSTIKIDSLCIKLGFVKEKDDAAEKCSHFSIRGYVSGMRERGSSNFLPFPEELPPMDVPNFKYWLCQSCLRNCGNASTSHQTDQVVSVCDQSMILPCARSFPPNICGKVAPMLPFGEGTSGVKPVDDSSDDDDDERVHPAFGLNESQIHADTVPQEPITFGGIDTNFGSKANAGRTLSNDGRDNELKDSHVMKETITTGPLGPTVQSSQQDDHPNGHTRRKTRKVRLLKELLGGNNEIHQRKKEKEKEKENPGTGVVPEPSSALPAVVKRKVPQPHGQDQRSADVTTPGNTCKKTKTFKGNPVAKSSMAEHSKDPGALNENDKRYTWSKHGTNNRNSNAGKVCSDPVTAWRSIFSDVATKTDNIHVTTTSKPTYDIISKDRGTGPRMAPPHPEKKFNFSKKMSKKSFGENSRTTGNVKDRQSETEIGLDLSLNYDPQSQLHSTMNQDYIRKSDFFMGESSIPRRIIPSKEGPVSVHDVSNRHITPTPRPPVLFQEQRPYTYGSYSGHQKLDFSDPHKWNTGVRGGYSDVIRPLNHQRQGKMVSMSMGRSDEREIAELMAKNQYERSLCGNNNNNSFIPHNSNTYMTSSSQHQHQHQHQDYDYLHTNMRNNPFFHQEQAPDHFNVFDGFQQSRNQQSGIWIPDSHYNHHLPPKGNKKMTNHTPHLYNTPTNIQVYEGFNKYNNNGIRHQNHETPDVFSNFHGYTRFSERDNNNNNNTQKNIMDLDLNVVAPNVIEEHNNFESLNMTSSKDYRTKNLDSSYPNEAIPAMQLLSLMDAGKSKHLVNTDERKFSKPLPYTHYNTSKPKPPPNFQFPNSRYFQSSSFGFQNGKLTSGQGQTYYKPQEEKSRASSSVSHGCRPEDSYVFPVPWHVSEDRSESVSVGPRVDPIETQICTINKNPADFSTPGPENVYMINVEDLVIRGGEKGNGNSNGPKRFKR
ncbi:hypothetical protein LXL04_008272 [Taraxacum kok-saghyz]